MKSSNQDSKTQSPILIVGGNGKTGRRVAERLKARGFAIRIASRSGETLFDWEDSSTWEGALKNVSSVYVTYAPDLAMPEAPARIRAFARLAVEHMVERLVLLSGRGEEEAQRCEQIVRGANPEWTVVRASWFSQNFSEAFLLEPLRHGSLALPAGAIREPFIDVNDIADVVVAALTETGHAGQIYDITGPRLMTFADAVKEIGGATGRELSYVQISADAFVQELRAQGTPEDLVSLTRYLFETVLDGRNECVTGDVQRALGREPRDFSEYAREAAATRVWEAAPAPERVMRDFVDQVLNGKDLSALDQFVHTDYIHRSPGEEIRGHQGLTVLLNGYQTAFPDMAVSIDELLAVEDATVLSFTLTGTHRGDLLGHAATNRRVRVRGMVRSRFRDGLIAEEWEILDQMALFEQLGLV